MEDNGWIKLHRKINDSKLWFLEPFTKAQAWIDLLLNANHKDKVIEIHGNLITIKRGGIGWSEITMAKRWQWSRNKVRRFLKLLENDGQIEQQKLYKITSITKIINYCQYQDGTTDDTTERQQKDNKRYTNKNVNNVKNDNNISNDTATPVYGNKDLISLKEFLMKNYPKPLMGVTDTRKLQNLKQICSKRKNQDEWMDDNWKNNIKKFLILYLQETEEDEYLVNSIDKLREKAKLWREYRGKLN